MVTGAMFQTGLKLSFNLGKEMFAGKRTVGFLSICSSFA